MTTVTLVDPQGNAPNFALGPGGATLPVSPTSTVLFADNHDGTVIDVVNRWSAPVLAGSGTMTQAGGNLVTTLGTTASNGAAITTIESFSPSIGNLTVGGLLLTEALPATNTNRCFGFYTRPGSWTAATPVQDGYVWELDITGNFGASIYNAGVRIFRQLFPMPSQFAPVSISYQGLTAYFFLNSFTVPAVTVPVLEPSVLSLPFGFHSINHTSPPAIAPVWSLPSVAVVDQAGVLKTIFNGQAISRLRSPGKFIALNGVSVAAETTIWTPATGRKFRLLGYNLTALGAAGNVVLKDNTAGATIPILPSFPAIGANDKVLPPALGNGYLSAAVNNVLTATGVASQTLSGFLVGCEE
jgi:hypothetical protein